MLLLESRLQNIHFIGGGILGNGGIAIGICKEA